MVAVVEQEESKMLSVRPGKEVVVRMKNDIGVLFRLSSLVSEKGVNVLAVSGAVCGEDCVVRLVTDDNRMAQEVLAENHFAPREENVVVVEMPHQPGMLKQLTKTLADGIIDIHHVYATAAPDQDKCLLVFHGANDEDAMGRLKQIQADSPEGQATSDQNADMVSEGGPPQ